MARPRKRPEDKLTEVVHFRMTKGESDRLQVHAIRAGQSVNEFLRFCVEKTVRLVQPK